MIKTLLQQWESHRAHHQAVLCSVIQWKGSVPRKDYPMMLVLDDGSILGTIGGGSMELKITRSAIEKMDNTTPAVFDFDMTGDSVHADVGLCGGTLTVLVESFTPDILSFYRELLDQIEIHPKRMVLLSVAPDSPVHRQFIDSLGDDIEADPAIQDRIRNIFEAQRSRGFQHESNHSLVWQPFTPPAIHIFGAGHVGQSVADLAYFNNLEVMVYDDRHELMTPERFPYAERVSLEFPINREALPGIPDQDFVLIASREHKHDRELLSALLQTPQAYIGLVSSARKWKILSESLLQEGFEQSLIDQVHAPVGMDINAQTVPEIAISIVSEMIAYYRKNLS